MFEDYSKFIDKILELLISKGIKVEELEMDHLGYQADSALDYDKRVAGILNISQQLSESIVGERRVGIFKLNQPLIYRQKPISIIEIFEPREGQAVKSAWEHIEFLVPDSLEEFISAYPQVDWDTSMIDREEFPMLILKLGDGLRAKFPRVGVEAELKRQENMS